MAVTVILAVTQLICAVTSTADAVMTGLAFSREIDRARNDF